MRMGMGTVERASISSRAGVTVDVDSEEEWRVSNEEEVDEQCEIKEEGDTVGLVPRKALASGTSGPDSSDELEELDSERVEGRIIRRFLRLFASETRC